MKRVLIIANLYGNNRQGYDLATVLRSKKYTVRLVQYSPKSEPGIGNFGVRFIRPHGIFSKFYVLRNIFAIACKSVFFRCDYVVCIGSPLLLLAFFLKVLNGAELTYYSLEYCAYNSTNRFIIKKFVDRYIDVEEHRQIQMFKDINITMPFYILYNMPLLTNDIYCEGGLRRYLKKHFPLSGREKIVLYAGSYQRYSCLENIVDASRKVSDNVIFVLMVAWGLPSRFVLDTSRCFIVPPQSGNTYFNWVADADGMLLPYESKTDFNVQNCSPQKLFDCYKLGIPYLASKRPLIEKIHQIYNLAGCFCDFSDVNSIVNGVSNLVKMKTKATSQRMIEIYRTKYNYSIHTEKLARFITGQQ